MPSFHFLSSVSALASHYSAFCSSFSTFFPLSPHSWLFRCSCSVHTFQVFPLIPDLVSHAIFPVLCTWLSVCFLSLYPDLLPQLLIRWSLWISPLGQILDVRFLSSASVLEPHYSASVSSVPFLPGFISQWLLQCSSLPFRFDVFHLIFHLVSHISFQVSRTWFSVCFLSSFPVSLPQLFHRCFPLSTSLRPFLCRDLQLTFDFLSSILVRFKLLSFLTFLFPSSRCPLPAVISMHISSSVQPVAMLSFRFWYSAFCDSFYRSLFRITVLPQCLNFSLRKSADFFLAYALEEVTWHQEFILFRCILAVYLGVSQAAPLYYHRKNTMSTTFLQIFTVFCIFCI